MNEIRKRYDKIGKNEKPVEKAPETKPVEASNPVEKAPEMKPVDFIAKVTSAALNCRNKPSLDGKVLKILPAGTEVRVINVEDGWVKYKVGDIVGYSMKRYLEEV